MSHPTPGLTEQYVLLADDDADDLLIFSSALRQVDPAISIITFPGGKSAYFYLEDIKPGGLLPALIVLDLNMPVWDGIKTIEVLQAHVHYRDIPTFIFTGSVDERNRNESISKGAAGFINKTESTNRLRQLAIMISAYRYFMPRFKSVTR